EVTKVEEPDTKPVVPEIAEQESSEAATTETVNPNASEVVAEEIPTVFAHKAVTLIAAEHAETSVEPESAENLSVVSQQVPAAAASLAASENTLPTEATQDVAPVVVEKLPIATVADSPAHDESAPSTEEAIPSLEIAPVEESVVKDVDMPSDVASAPDHTESTIEQPVSASLPVDQPVKNVIVATAETEEHAATATSEEPSTVETLPLVAEERSAEPKEVFAEPTLASEEPIKTPMVESVTSSDDSVAQPALFVEDTSVPVADQESVGPQGGDNDTEQSKEATDEPVLSQQADTEQREDVSAVEKAPITPATVTLAVEPITDPEPTVSEDNHSATEQREVVSAVEDVLSTPVPEASSAEKEAAVAEQVQAVLVEQATDNLVENIGETVVQPVSASVAEVLIRHEEIPVTVENIPTNQDEAAVDSHDKVEPPKDVSVMEGSTSESIPTLTLNVPSADKEQVLNAVVEGGVDEPTAVETIVNLASAADAVVAQQEEIPLIVEGSENLEVTKSWDQIEPLENATSVVERTIEGATPAEVLTEHTNNTSPVATIITTGETSIEEPTLSQEEVEAVIASIPSVSDVAVNVLDSVAEGADQNKNENQNDVEDNIALHAGVDVERPKSPWTPSFQVTTAGRGVSPDKQQMEPGATQLVVDPITETWTETAEAEELQSVKTAPTTRPVIADEEKFSKDVEQPLVSPPELVIVDKSPFVEPAEEEDSSEAPVQDSVHSSATPHLDKVGLAQEPSARPWTPSYSVHSQGSPLPTQANLAEEPLLHDEESFADNENEAAELEEMKFAENEDVPVIVSSAPLDQRAQSQEFSATASNKAQAAAEVASPLTTDVETKHILATDMETKHPLQPTVPSAQASLDSVHTEVNDRSEAIAASLEHNNETHVLEKEDDLNNSLAETAASVTDTEVPRSILGAGKEKEVSALCVPSGHISEELVPDVEERTASTWSTSYSVIVQGTPVQERPNPLDKAASITETDVTTTEDVESEAPVVGAPPASAENVAETEVSSVEIAKAEVVTKATEEPYEDSTVKETSIVPTPLVSGELVEEHPVAAITVPESLVDLNKQDLPKSPRLLSQSVATEEISSADKADLNKFGPLASLPQHTTIDAGSVAVDPVRTAMNLAVNPAGEAFPITEQPVAEPSKKSKSSGLRLTTPNENASTDGSSASPDAIPPVTGRSRLESTASSRFFPGAWFSPSKTVDESRPFFEVVQGEFTPKNRAVARDPSIDEGPSMAEQSTATQGETNKETPPASQQRKSRWCVIM
ncbi:hypothetical protein E4T56_gene3829, partial [Termitomyces sp. T112]